MNVVFLGATKGMGRALARLLAARGDRLFLVGREPAELEKSAADLDARAPTGRAVAGGAGCDLLEPESFAPALERAWSALGTVDLVVVTAGLFATQDALEADRAAARRLLEANFSGTVLFCEEARERLLAQAGQTPFKGTLCVFSSVAGDRGRKPVVLYGAAKAGLSRYLEGLDHRFRSRGLRVVCVKPGWVRTSMTEGLPAPPFAGEPEPVARRVLKAIDRGTPVVYAPAPWRWVMTVIRALPRFVLRRVGF
jgi:NAD(P)-dependent dehydrogenase (short-subunit alcohol dehydrogenase family)